MITLQPLIRHRILLLDAVFQVFELLGALFGEVVHVEVAGTYRRDFIHGDGGGLQVAIAPPVGSFLAAELHDRPRLVGQRAVDPI